MFVDLHIHTVASDGCWDIDEVLSKVKEKNITTFSITDHDIIDNSVKVLKLLNNNDGIRFILGVEVSCVFDEKEYHVLGYNFDFNNLQLIKLLDCNVTNRERFFSKVVKVMEQQNKCISSEEYETYKTSIREKYNKRGGWEIPYSFLYKNKIVNSVFEFEELKKSALKQVVSKLDYCTARQAINAIKQAGGQAILAHPNKYFRDSKLPINKLNDWFELGIDGIECFTCYSDEKYYIYYVEFCKNNNLLITGGSDVHGLGKREIGVPKITPDMINI